MILKAMCHTYLLVLLHMSLLIIQQQTCKHTTLPQLSLVDLSIYLKFGTYYFTLAKPIIRIQKNWYIIFANILNSFIN
ncbi:hypothetical protein RND81_14G230400 [Saponaria officinalis]|uniref:Secreted protein n=1 Tax=Saponaria officinalis TaxID=3572 RepID=A0AAW1GRA4_SAPOF